MFSTVTSWLGGTKPDYEVSTKEEKKEIGAEDEGQETTDEKKEVSDEANKKTKEGPQMPNISDVGEKTLTAAKEWGGKLFYVSYLLRGHMVWMMSLHYCGNFEFMVNRH